MSRTAFCETCHQPFDTPSDTGRVPKQCPTCNPSFTNRYRGEVIQLRDRIDELEEALDRCGRHLLPGDIGREDLVAAVRQVAIAQGRHQTRKALLHLVDVADTWATRLAEEEAA